MLSSTLDKSKHWNSETPAHVQTPYLCTQLLTQIQYLQDDTQVTKSHVQSWTHCPPLYQLLLGALPQGWPFHPPQPRSHLWCLSLPFHHIQVMIHILNSPLIVPLPFSCLTATLQYFAQMTTTATTSALSLSNLISFTQSCMNTFHQIYIWIPAALRI